MEMLQLLSRLQAVPLQAAVSVFRAMHDAGGAQAEDGADATMGATGLGTNGTAPPSRLASRPEIEQLVKALLALQTVSHSAGSQAELAYEQICRRFQEFQSQLRRQKLVVERLLGRSFKAENAENVLAPVFQQTVDIQCERGGKASGKFRCMNRVGRTATVTAVPGTILGDSSGRIDLASLRIVPPDSRIDAGRSQIFEATIDLSACPELPDRHIDAEASITVDGETVLKVWIAVEVHDAIS